MLANSNKSQANSRIISILERASSRGSSKSNLSLHSQKISQNIIQRPANPNYLQLSSSQGFSQRLQPTTPAILDSTIHSCHHPFGLLQSSRQTLGPVSDPYPTLSTQSSYPLVFTNPSFMQDTRYCPQDIGCVDHESYPTYQTFSQTRPFSLPVTDQNAQRISFSKTQTSPIEAEPAVNTNNSFSDIVPTYDGEANLKQNTPQDLKNNGLLDELGIRLMTNLKTLKDEMKKEIEACNNVDEAQKIVMDKFNLFDTSLRQILGTYEQFEAQLKNIEALFTQKVQLILKGFDQNSEKFENVQNNVKRRVTLNKDNLLKQLKNVHYEPLKQSITKMMVEQEMRKKRFRAPVIKQSDIYARQTRPIPSYAITHSYNTRRIGNVDKTKKILVPDAVANPKMDIEEISTKKNQDQEDTLKSKNNYSMKVQAEVQSRVKVQVSKNFTKKTNGWKI